MARQRRLQWVLIVAPVRKMGVSTHPDRARAEVQGPFHEDTVREVLKRIMATRAYAAGEIEAWMRPVARLDYANETAARVGSLGRHPAGKIQSDAGDHT